MEGVEVLVVGLGVAGGDDLGGDAFLGGVKLRDLLVDAFVTAPPGPSVVIPRNPNSISSVVPSPQNTSFGICALPSTIGCIGGVLSQWHSRYTLSPGFTTLGAGKPYEPCQWKFHLGMSSRQSSLPSLRCRLSFARVPSWCMCRLAEYIRKGLPPLRKGVGSKAKECMVSGAKAGIFIVSFLLSQVGLVQGWMVASLITELSSLKSTEVRSFCLPAVSVTANMSTSLGASIWPMVAGRPTVSVPRVAVEPR